MFAKFWEGIGSKLADRWAAVSIPALLFWMAGVLAYVRGHGGIRSLDRPMQWVTTQSQVVQLGLLVATLVGVVVSGIIMQRLTLPVLRLLEGYWPSWLEPMRRPLVDWQASKLARLEDRFGKLAAELAQTTLSAEQRREYVRLDSRLHRVPVGEYRLMPTRVGNVLRAAESRPVDKYGLDAVKCWPQLWLLLPDAVKQELNGARASLDQAAAACLWGLLLLVWSPWTLWAVPVGLAIAVTAYLFWLPDRAEVFADLVEAAFDVHRRALYSAFRWPLPSDPADERKSGALLMEYLWRGSDAAIPKFTVPSDDGPDSMSAAQTMQQRS
jgi:hypothetical protein